MRRLIPDHEETTVEQQLDSYRPWEKPHPEGRPFVAMNFAVTVDGRASIGGVSGPIGSEARHRDAGRPAEPASMP